MSTPPLNPTSLRFPFELRDQPPEVVQAHRFAFQGLADLNQAIAALKSQVDTNHQTITETVTTSGGVTPAPPTPFPFPGLGGVNNQTGNTAYATQTTDNGALLILSDASPVAVSLNSAVTAPYFLFATNFGAGLVTFTPTTGNINSGATFTLSFDYTSILFFDGINWWATEFPTVPATFTAIAHEFLNSYNATTGLFTAAQPAFTDVSGTATTAQIGTGTPSAGKYVDGGTGAWTTLSLPIAPMTNITSLVTASGVTVSGGVGTVGSAVATISISAIPSGYNNLKVVFNGKTSGGADEDCLIQFNGDTGAHYDWAFWIGGAGATINGHTNADTSIHVIRLPTTSGMAAAAEILIYGYDKTVWNKTIISTCASYESSNSGINAQHLPGIWLNTAAITSFTLKTAGGNNFPTGTTIAIYGFN